MSTKLFTAIQEQYIRARYLDLSRKELLRDVNRRYGLDLRLSQLVAFLKNHKIRSGRDGRFKKGNVPWSAGIKGVLHANRTSFKKGQRPANYKPIGSEITNCEGYVMVKVSDTNPYKSSTSGYYRFKHHLIWEAAYGDVPEGHVLRFIDGDRRNLTLDNLELVSRAENAQLNALGYNDAEPEIKPVLKNIVALQGLIASREQP